MSQEQHNLLKSGEFARLARTTKRTILWYTEKGLLKPVKIDGMTGYRYYEPKQILNFQVIFLLSKLRFSLSEIKIFLKKDKFVKDFFLLKKPQIEEELRNLKKALVDVNHYYHNLGENGTLVDPIIKMVKPFSIYYLDKKGPYAKIKEYALEFKSHFSKIPQNAVYLTIFLNDDYNPKNAKMKIGVIKQDNMKLKEEFKSNIKSDNIPSFKSLMYVHRGSGVMLSLLWQELAKYRKVKGYKLDTSLLYSSLELCRLTSLNQPISENDMIFKLHLPIK